MVKDIKKFLNETYNIDARSVASVDFGVMNSNYVISTEEGDYIFRINEHKNRDEVKFEIEVLEYLDKSNFPSPRIIKSGSGVYVTNFFSKPAILYAYMPGTPMGRITTDFIRETGQMMGRFHMATEDYAPEAPKSSWEPKELLSLVEDNKQKMIQCGFEGIEKVLHFCEQELPKFKFPESLPKGITHQDIKPENIIVHNGAVRAFIDFDNAYYGTLLTDLSTTVIWTCFEGGRLDFSLVKSLIDGYQKERRLADEEKMFLYKAIKHRLVREVFIGPYVTMHEPDISKERAEYFMSLYNNGLGDENGFQKKLCLI